MFLYKHNIGPSKFSAVYEAALMVNRKAMVVIVLLTTDGCCTIISIDTLCSTKVLRKL